MVTSLQGHDWSACAICGRAASQRDRHLRYTLPDPLEAWRELAQWLRDARDEANDYYAYPGLHERVHVASA